MDLHQGVGGRRRSGGALVDRMVSPPWPLRPAHNHRRNVHHRCYRNCHRDAARSWCGDLPRRVRNPEGSSNAQTDHRDPCRNPLGCPRILGSRVHRTRDRSTDLPDRRRFQHVVRRACRRRAHHAARGLGIRGRNASCPGVAPRGIIWTWSQPSDYHHTSRGSSSGLWDRRVPHPRVLHARSEKR